MNPGGFTTGQPKTTAPAASTPTKPLFSFVNSSTKSPANSSAQPVTVQGICASGASKPDQTDCSQSRPIFYFGNNDQSFPTSKPTTSEAPKSSGVFDKLQLAPNQTGKPIFGTGSFSFSFGLPKTTDSGTGVTSTPVSAANTSKGDDRDTDQVELVDEEKLTFKPVLEVMPEKVEVRTGEENEEVVFCERAKLYRWTANMWRERGVGEIKLLRTPNTGSMRCLMRRDHVLKVCCNHPITVGMQLKPMTNTTDGRAWTWWAIDFTEPMTEADADQSHNSSVGGEPDASGGRRETFAVRFRTTEHAQAFKESFEAAVSAAEKRAGGKPTEDVNSTARKTVNVDLDQGGQPSDNDDVIVVEKPPEVSDEQLARARQLMLPDEFYSFENGVIHGEAEKMTEAEEAEEDKLLEAAVRRGIQRHQPDTISPKSTGSMGVTAAGDDKKSDMNAKTKEKTPENQKTASLSGFGTLSSLKDNSLSSTYVPQIRGLPDFSTLSASVPKDGKLSFGTSFGTSATNTSYWSTAATPLFANFSSKERGETGENGTPEETGEHDPHYEPIIALPELVQVSTVLNYFCKY
ncbi:unnamed protein product [Echinostoma caproni]|uniref:RanBD1 domain-containing protein n=1 Tax=Echinostoma caproni TaxID=27848 RepID=A0A183A0C6_9TREM|nr:unnamed protein product [Echinostoma caproni]